MRTRRTVCSVFLILASLVPLFSGDVATFVNLGFSKDSRYFMFGYHGIEAQSGRAFAEIFTVDVAANRFMSGGVRRGIYSEPLQPGQGSEGAFFTLLEENGPTSQKAAINHLRQGRLLYVLINGDKDKESLEFRDFNTDTHYRVRLKQKTQGEGPKVKGAFHIELEVHLKDGRRFVHTLGSPDYYRDPVLGYRIRSIISSPDERHLVFVVEKDEYSPGGKSIRYMVETLKVY